VAAINPNKPIDSCKPPEEPDEKEQSLFHLFEEVIHGSSSSNNFFRFTHRGQPFVSHSTQSVSAQVLSLQPLLSQSEHSGLPSILELAKPANLTKKEEEELISLIKSWPLSSHVCLLDFLGLDFYHKLCQIKLKTDDPSVDNALSQLHGAFFLLYQSLVLAKTKNPFIVERMGKSSYLPSIPDCISAFALVQHLFASLRPQQKHVDMSTAKGRLQAKLHSSTSPINNLVNNLVTEAENRLAILQKILAESEAHHLLLDLGMGTVSESRFLDIADHPQRPECLKIYVSFIDECITDLAKTQRSGVSVNWFSQLKLIIKKLLQQPNKPEFLAEFSEKYAYCAWEGSRSGMHFQSAAQRASTDLTYTRQVYCDDHKTSLVSTNGTQETFACMLHANFAANYIFLNWLEDIHVIISRRLILSLQEKYTPSTAYINRVNLNCFCLSMISLLDGTPTEENPILETFRLQAKELFQKTFHAEKRFFASSLVEFLPKMTFLANQRRFMLSAWMDVLSDFRPQIDQFGQTLKDASSILNCLLSSLKKDDLQGLTPAQWKKEFKRIIALEAFEYSLMTMVLQDVDALFHGHQVSGTDHLLPDWFVDLSEFEGLEGLFAPEEAPVIVVAEVPEASEEEPVLPLPPVKLSKKAKKKAKQEKAKQKAEPLTSALQPEPLIPSRRQFLMAKKRKLIMGLLEQAGFIARKGNGSHVVMSNSETGATTVVPKDVSDVGLRGAIFKQAFPENH